MRQPHSASSTRRETVAAMRRKIAAKEALIRQQAASLARSRVIFERASVAARIGVWECDLDNESLVWTDVVYDIFDLPRGAPLDRAKTLECYPPESRRILEAFRSQAIADRAGFNLDTEIVTMAGRRRWIRITATVECENDRPIRIFGMKQDITEEKILLDRTRYLAEFDVMTGLANRSSFQIGLGSLAEGDGGALLLVDLDGFKEINDSFGHAIGDECLKAVAGRLEHLGAEAELVARIGGDEFALLLGPGFDDERIATLAGSIVAGLRRPVDCGPQRLVFGASVGIARVGDCNASELFVHADTALYAAKAAGRNTFRMFEPATAIPGSTRAA